MDLTYHSYLQIEELTSLQKLQSPDEHDEMLFIVIHQTYELWFKEILHEMDYICRMLEKQSISKAQGKLKRILTIFKVLVHQVDILETMTPLEFLSFRDYLQSASGFQSYQFRELEFLMGQKNEKHLKRFPEGSSIRNKLQKRFDSDSLWMSFLRYLQREGYAIPFDQSEGDVHLSTRTSTPVQEVLIDIYQHNPELALFCELMMDLDEGVQEWRYRHVKMVERTIGNKIGTGGSSGVEYLKNSLFKPLFPDLWEIRTEFKL
jgi:tryptophan 2,3-dioxygenase